MASVFDVAKYFLMLAASGTEDAGEAMTHLKLQKLLYYAQGFHLALYDGKPIFEDTIEAWKQGPVVNSVWHAYKEKGSAPIAPDDKFDPAKLISTEEEEVLIDVWNAYGQFSAWKLRNMTHEEPPWRNAYKENTNATITLKSMCDYFSTQVA
jgi:uncharacterized phage-associated protein